MDIPKFQIQNYVGRLHVSTTDQEIRDKIAKGAQGNPNWTPKLIRKAQAYAIRCHRANQKLYKHVMGGM